MHNRWLLIMTVFLVTAIMDIIYILMAILLFCIPHVFPRLVFNLLIAPASWISSASSWPSCYSASLRLTIKSLSRTSNHGYHLILMAILLFCIPQVSYWISLSLLLAIMDIICIPMTFMLFCIPQVSYWISLSLLLAIMDIICILMTFMLFCIPQVSYWIYLSY
jgi:hypothetical protein